MMFLLHNFLFNCEINKIIVNFKTNIKLLMIPPNPTHKRSRKNSGNLSNSYDKTHASVLRNKNTLPLMKKKFNTKIRNEMLEDRQME